MKFSVKKKREYQKQIELYHLYINFLWKKIHHLNTLVPQQNPFNKKTLEQLIKREHTKLLEYMTKMKGYKAKFYNEVAKQNQQFKGGSIAEKAKEMSQDNPALKTYCLSSGREVRVDFEVYNKKQYKHTKPKTFCELGFLLVTGYQSVQCNRSYTLPVRFIDNGLQATRSLDKIFVLERPQ